MDSPQPAGNYSKNRYAETKCCWFYTGFVKCQVENPELVLRESEGSIRRAVGTEFIEVHRPWSKLRSSRTTIR